MFVQAEVPFVDNEEFAKWWALSNNKGFTIEHTGDYIRITGQDVSIEKVDLLRKEVQLYNPHSFFSFS